MESRAIGTQDLLGVDDKPPAPGSYEEFPLHVRTIEAPMDLSKLSTDAIESILAIFEAERIVTEPVAP